MKYPPFFTMKFTGKPGLVVTHDHKRIGRFDENGVMEVTNPKLILRMKTKFKPIDEVVCKQCGATFESKGLFLAHCRKEHKRDSE